jgi:hypothetical protein
VASLLRGEWGKARGVGGLFVLSYHSQLLARAEYVPALAAVARELVADKSAWITTADSVAEWWLGKSALDVRVVRRSQNELDVIVRNRGARAVENAVVRVALPGGGRILKATVPHLAAIGTARLWLRHVPAHSSVSMRVAISG